MDSMADITQKIKENHLVSFLEKRVKFHVSQSSRKRKSTPKDAALHDSTAHKHTLIKKILEGILLREDLEPEDSAKDDSAPIQDDLFSLSASSIEDLPSNVVEVLKLTPSDKLSGQVVDLLKIAGRPLNVQELIVGLYRKYNAQIEGRNLFASKLYRMCQTKHIESTEGKKGYYQLPKN